MPSRWNERQALTDAGTYRMRQKCIWREMYDCEPRERPSKYLRLAALHLEELDKQKTTKDSIRK